MTDDRGYQESYSGEPPGTSSGREDRHSRMGITSFILFIIGLLLLVGLIILSAVVFAPLLESIDPQALQDPESFQNPEDAPPELQQAATAILLLTIGFLGLPVLNLVGLGLGIAGLIQKRRKRLFAVLGTVLNGLVILAIVGLFLLGVLGSLLGAPAG